MMMASYILVGFVRQLIIKILDCGVDHVNMLEWLSETKIHQF